MAGVVLAPGVMTPVRGSSSTHCRTASRRQDVADHVVGGALPPPVIAGGAEVGPVGEEDEPLETAVGTERSGKAARPGVLDSLLDRPPAEAGRAGTRAETSRDSGPVEWRAIQDSNLDDW